MNSTLYSTCTTCNNEDCPAQYSECVITGDTCHDYAGAAQSDRAS